MSPHKHRTPLPASIIVACLVALASPASAGPAVSFAVAGQSGCGPNNVEGWEFQTTAGVTVSALGVYDSSADGLDFAIPVGLYDAACALVASVTVPAGTAAPLLDRYRYVGIAPVALAAGQTFRVAAVMHCGDNTPGFNSLSNVALDPSLTGVLTRRIGFGSALACPTETSSLIEFAPNFLIGPACGNGIVQTGEQCDDGNLTDGDCCSSTCQYEQEGNPCLPDSEICTDDLCNATGTCVHPAGNAGMACRAGAGECDLAEECNGTTPACPPDTFKLDDTPCTDDGLFCTGEETCLDGVCTSGGDPCSQAMCDETADQCVTPTPTVTAIFTATATRSATATHTDVPTPTTTPTSSRTRTATASPVNTATASSTSVATASVTGTQVSSATATSTHTPTLTITAIPSLTRTATHTATGIPTSTLTSSSTRTSTSLTPTPTATATASPSASASTTATQIGSSSATVTSTPVTTGSATTGATATATSIASATATDGQTAIATRTATATPPSQSPTLTQPATPSHTPISVVCIGDCNRDGMVLISELITGVSIALERQTLDRCPEFDASGNGAVEVNELIAAVRNALEGCPS